MNRQDALLEVKDRRRRVRQEDVGVSEFCLDPVKVAIARLSDEDIRQMDDPELVELARISGLFSTREWSSYLRFMEHEELDQTVFLARRLCRQRINAAHKQRGRQVPFTEDL